MNLHRVLKVGSGLRDAGDNVSERAPTTPIRQGRSTPGGMIAVFVLIGFIVVAVSLFT